MTAQGLLPLGDAETVPCVGCGTETDKLDLFPGGICLRCHAAKVEAEPMWTAEQITAAFGGKRVRR